MGSKNITLKVNSEIYDKYRKYGKKERSYCFSSSWNYDGSTIKEKWIIIIL